MVPGYDVTNWIMYLAYLIFAFLFVFICIKGSEGKGLAERLRFGLYVGLMMCTVGAFVMGMINGLLIEWLTTKIFQAPSPAFSC
jgi:hypothetical protein